MFRQAQHDKSFVSLSLSKACWYNILQFNRTMGFIIYYEVYSNADVNYVEYLYVPVTFAGQIVMEGFLNIRLKPWLRRLVTRLIAIIPAFIVTIIYGSSGTANLLVLSQVILSMQLSFAVVPLVLFTNSKNKMGQFANKPFLKVLVWIISAIIICLNAYLLYGTFF